MSMRMLLAAGLLTGGLVMVPSLARAESSSYTSRISEVDACNQAQYLMPEQARVEGYRFDSGADKEGNLVNCTVGWSTDSKAVQTNRPILFPNRVSIPIIWSGWF